MNHCFNAPPLAYLSEKQLSQLHDTSIEILEYVGSVIKHEQTIELLCQNGATANGQTVFIPGALVNQAIELAPAKVEIYDRAQQPALTLFDTNVYFGTGPDCQYLHDTESGEIKPFGLEDMINAIRLTDELSHIDFVMSMALAGELDSQSAFLTKYKAMVMNTTKPLVVVSGPDVDVLKQIVEISALFAGGKEQLVEKPNFLLLVDPTSPLVHTDDAVSKLIYMAKNRLPVVYAPGIMAGATSPVTMAGAIAQANAEILAGLVVHQLTNPGAPFVFGGGMSPLDMKSGQPTYSAPEAMISQAGLCQLGRDLYQLPTWGFGGCSASKTCDEQAVIEASNYLMMSAWMGSNLVHDVGYMEFGLTFSLELLTICNEVIGQIRRLMGGIPMEEEQLAMEAITRVGPGGNFLTDPHTLQHFKKNWQPDLIDRKTRTAWQSQNSTTLVERTRIKMKKILKDHQPAKIHPDVLSEIEKIN